MLKYTLNRFEENFAICENRDTKEMIDIPISELPLDIKEGDIFTKIDDKYEIDYELTKTEKQEVKNLMNKLWKK